ncbi:MAG: hypothetical protein JWP01_2333 [Myxococcales bacterium]|nr:hypothetical protein [Myxococcales bacterium]
MGSTQEKTKALVVATRCTTVEQFVATFHKFCDDSTFFVSTLAERPVGLETAFSIQLEDKTPVLRGLCEVVEAWSTPLNRFGRPGVRLAVRRLTNESMVVFKQLQVARVAAEAAAAASPPPAPSTAVAPPTPPARTPIHTPPPTPRFDPRVSEAPSLPRIGTTPANGTPIAAASAPVRAAAHGTPTVPVARVPLLSVALPTPAPVARVLGAIATSPASRPAPGSMATMQLPTIIRAPEPPPSAPPPNVTPPPPAAIARGSSPRPPESTTVVEPDLAAPEPIAASDERTTPVAVESRTPGSSYVLPANPLMNLTDQSLGGFIDCALYEETGNFFRAPGYEDSLVDIDDVAAPPPPVLAPVSAIRTGEPTAPPHNLSPYAFSPPSEPAMQFAPEATPLPMLAPLAVPVASRYSEPLFAPDAAPYAPPPMPTASAAPVDSTAAMFAILSPSRRRWLVIGGAAAGLSLLVLVIVLASGGGDRPSTPRVATASAATAPSKPERAVPTPSPSTPEPAATPATAAPAVAKAATSMSAAAKVATPAAAVDAADEELAADPGGPPVVGTGPCRLTVSSTPAGSIVRVDDQAIGPSPITIDGPCKRRKVDVKHPRYALGTKYVNLVAETPTAIQVPLARPTHAITIVTVPPGATISIAGNRAGTSPTSVKVMGFTQLKLSVEKKGYKPVVQKVYSKVDQDRVMIKLVRGK